MVKRGERPIAAGALDQYAQRKTRPGTDLDPLSRDGAFVIPSPSSIVKGSPHPNAAKPFADFMLSG